MKSRCRTPDVSGLDPVFPVDRAALRDTLLRLGPTEAEPCLTQVELEVLKSEPREEALVQANLRFAYSGGIHGRATALVRREGGGWAAAPLGGVTPRDLERLRRLSAQLAASSASPRLLDVVPVDGGLVDRQGALAEGRLVHLRRAGSSFFCMLVRADSRCFRVGDIAALLSARAPSEGRLRYRAVTGSRHALSEREVRTERAWQADTLAEHAREPTMVSWRVSDCAPHWVVRQGRHGGDGEWKGEQSGWSFASDVRIPAWLLDADDFFLSSVVEEKDSGLALLQVRVAPEVGAWATDAVKTVGVLVARGRPLRTAAYALDGEPTTLSVQMLSSSMGALCEHIHANFTEDGLNYQRESVYLRVFTRRGETLSLGEHAYVGGATVSPGSSRGTYSPVLSVTSGGNIVLGPARAQGE